MGILISLWVLFSGELAVTQQVLRISLFAVALYVFSILCGRLLLREPLKGLRLSLVNQLLQVLYFSFGAYGFQYVSGLRVGVGMDMTGGWLLKFRLALSSFHFSFDADMGQKLIGINLVALLLIFWIERLQEKLK